MLVGQLALMVATAFASACTYINVVEQPARLGLEPRALLVEWKSSYKRGTVMQVSLAVVAASFGVTAFVMLHDWRWLCGALLLVALLPYTLLGVMPTNRHLMSVPDGAEHEGLRTSVQRWGRLHAVRTELGIGAAVMFLWATL